MSAARAISAREPTAEGIRRWPPDGYLRLNLELDVRQQVACTCTGQCGECKGECGCEACELGWLVYQDDHALWDERGNLINVVELGAAWKRVADPRQLRLRFHPDSQLDSVDHPSADVRAVADVAAAGRAMLDDERSGHPLIHPPME